VCWVARGLGRSGSWSLGVLEWIPVVSLNWNVHDKEGGDFCDGERVRHGIMDRRRYRERRQTQEGIKKKKEAWKTSGRKGGVEGCSGHRRDSLG